MKYRYLIMVLLLFFTACGGGNGDNTIKDVKNPLNTNSPFQHASKTVTIYVHGFKQDGYYRNAIYGDKYDCDFTTKLRNFTGLPSIDNYDKNNFSNLVIGVEYYGNQSPTYYTPNDIADINSSTNGIPRFALVVAKFTKYIMAQTGATKVNIVSASMGSLITRYMIEKDLEHLASDKKIEKWLMAEAVLRGNYALSKIDEIDSEFIRDTINSFFKDSPEMQQMKYKWIEENITPHLEAMSSSYYKDILVGQISLTDSDNSDGIGLRYILQIHGKFKPNDGYQLVKDTYFEEVNNTIQVPSHTLVHSDHVSINESDSVFATISAFLEAKKRVRVTLVDVTVKNLHEEIISGINESAEIVFANNTFSPKAESRWNFSGLIAQRVYDSGTLPIHHYKEKNVPKIFNQILFDDFVLSSENRLKIKIEGYEIDRSTKYDINEVSVSSKESMGYVETSIDLVDGATYHIVSDDWSGNIKVEMVEM
ncbi:MAG: hypothetical protein GXO60_06085 [Epsilonproteobacteria bacterium]|nr:hypothetical protein [Campylobacterota bacterium]